MLVDNLVKQLATSYFLKSTSTSFIHTSSQQASSTKSAKRGAASQYARKMLKDYQFPEFKSDEVEHKYISGSGPGGQNVNQLQNAAQLRHIPTNIVVKVHESRLLQDNVKLAFDRLKLALDKHLNGDNSYESQFKRFERKYEHKVNKAREKRRQIKKSSGEDSSDSS